MKDQQALPGIRRADHSNLGKDWEAQLEAVHEFYRLQARADIVKNPVEWIYISENDYKKGFAENPAQVARTGDNLCMRRVPSDVDFAGGGKDFSICFDAKTTVSRSRVELKMFRPRQIARLKESKRCGGLSGFLLHLSALQRTFWLPVGFIAQKEEKYLASTAGGRRRAKPGSASITLEELEEFCLEIKRNPANNLWDYLAGVRQLR